MIATCEKCRDLIDKPAAEPGHKSLKKHGGVFNAPPGGGERLDQELFICIDCGEHLVRPERGTWNTEEHFAEVPDRRFL